MDGHKTESRNCPAYIQVQNDNIIFWESKDVLSNFYPCDVSYADKVFKSSEHAYQYAKLDFLGESEMAAEVLATNMGKQAKLVASRIPYTRLTEWDDHKGSIMRDIIRAKANSCFKLKKALLDSVDRVIAEGTIDSYWGIGMPDPHIAATTNPDFYNGRNILSLVSYIDYNNLCISEIVVSENCVKTVISQLNNSAPGHDSLPPSIMKQLANEYVIPLTHLINLSIVQGDFPSELKLAKVLPIYKSEEEHFTQNYRPISVLPYFSKIYERAIYNHLMQYINSNDILYDKQFGFRKGHSTSHAIINLVEKVSKALDTGKIVVGVYIEIRKAFDFVRHSTLLDKLHKIGIRGNLFC